MALPLENPGINPEMDYNMPGAAPQSPVPPGPRPPITLDPVQVNGTIPRPPITLPEVNVTGNIPKPLPGQVPTPGGPPTSFGASPLGPKEGVQADAQVFADIASYYKQSADAMAAGKLEEAARHGNFAREQELSVGQSNKDWAAAQADQVKREAAMTAAIAKGRALNVDPDAYWNRKGTASNILAAISVGLGAFGSGMTKGATGNPALTLVNNAIEHDIASQKDNIENYWKSVSQQGHLDDNAFNRALVTQNLQANMRLAGYKVYESDLKSIQAKSDSQMVKLGAQKQIDDLQLAMNAQRKQLAATIAAQQAAAQAQSNKDSETFNKDVLDYMKEHPGMSPQDASRDVAAVNPSRTARLGSRSALPQSAQEDFVYGKEKGFAGAFNQSLQVIAQHNIKEYEQKTGHKASEEDKAAILAQTQGVLLKQHPEFGTFQFWRPSVNGGLIDVRPQDVAATPGQGGPDRRSKEQIEKDREREIYVDQPVFGPNGQPVIGADGKPQMQKVKQLATTKEAGEKYIKWSNLEPTIKRQIAELKDAWQKGDVARYNSLRNALIEKDPAFYGFERGPSSAQVEHTFKDLIPEYNHWYSVGQYGGLTPGQASRDEAMAQKFQVLEDEVNSIGTDVRTNTFGPQAGSGRTVGSYSPAPPSAPVTPTAPVEPKVITDSKGNQFVVKELNGKSWAFNMKGEPIGPYAPYMPKSAKPQ